MKKGLKVFLVLFLCLGIANTKISAAGIGITYEEQFSEKTAPFIASMFGDDISDEIDQTTIDSRTKFEWLNDGIYDLDGFEIFVNLESIHAVMERIDKFPENLSALPKLKELEISFYDMDPSTLPASMANFKTLETLALSGNYYINEFPTVVKTIPNLKNLNLAFDSITFLSKEDELFLRGLENANLSGQRVKVFSTGGVLIGNDVPVSTFPILGQSREYSVPVDIDYTITSPSGKVISITPSYDDEGNVIIDKSYINEVGLYGFDALINDATGLLDGSTYHTTFSIYETIENPINITLNGDAIVELTVGDTFIDPGAVARDNKEGLWVDISGNVDTTKPGTYTLTYTATNAYETKSITRTVIVKEKASAETPLTPTPSNTSPTTPANPIKKPSVAGTTSTTNTTASPATRDTHTTPWGLVMMISGMVLASFLVRKRQHN